MSAGALRVDIDLPRRDFRVRAAFEVGAETVAIVGPSGSGKSSILRAIAGLERPAAGRVELGGEVWLDTAARVDRPPEERSVGLVFQEYALFPHMDVARNVSFGGRRRSAELLERLGIAHLARARPGALSGGERQRVALARALARDPRALLLDEPMSALDAHTRATVRTELHELLRGLGLPTLIVSHDFEDAGALASRVAVVVRGRIVQTGTPGDLVAAPADAFVASLTGANLLQGVAGPAGGGLTAVVLDAGGVVYSADAARGPVTAVVHPAEVVVAAGAPAEDSSTNHLHGTIRSVVRLGNRARVRVGPLTAEITTASLDRLGLGEGDAAVASFKALATRLVPAAPADGQPSAVAAHDQQGGVVA